MTISYKVLAKLLLKLGHQYVVLPCREPEFEGRSIVKFVVAHQYPVGPFTYLYSESHEFDAMRRDRLANTNGNIMLHFDMDNDTIVSCCCMIYSAIREERTNILTKLAQKKSEGDKNVRDTTEISSSSETVPCNAT